MRNGGTLSIRLSLVWYVSQYHTRLECTVAYRKHERQLWRRTVGPDVDALRFHVTAARSSSNNAG